MLQGVRDETVKKYEKVKALISDGTPLKHAAREVGIAPATYRKLWKKDPDAIRLRKPKKGAKQKREYTKRAVQNFIDLPLQDATRADDKVIVIVCSSSTLKNTLENLR